VISPFATSPHSQDLGKLCLPTGVGVVPRYEALREAYRALGPYGKRHHSHTSASGTAA
jgi:hypothetical protein